MPTLIDTLITKLSFQSDTRGLVAAEKGIERITKKTNTASMAMAKFNHVLSLIGVSFGIHKLIEYGNEWDDVNNKIKSTGLSGNALSNTLDRIKTISNQTGTSLHANAELYQQLSLSMGELVGQKDLFTVMDSLNKVFAINSTSVRSSKLATVALGKALEGPTVAYREIKAAMLDVPGIAQVLNAHFKSLGTTTQEALEGNKFASKELVKILIASNQGITKQFNATKRTFPQAITALKNEMTEFFGSLRNQTGITEKLVSSVERLSEKFKSFTKFLKENEDAVKAFGGAILTFLTLLSIRLGIISALMLSRFLPLIAGLSLITLAIQDLYVFLTGGNSVIERFLRWLGLSEEAIDNLRSGITSIIKTIGNLINRVLESKAALSILVSVLGTLGTLWVVGKIVKFASAIGGVTSAVYNLAAATGKQGKVGFLRSFIREIPTAVGQIGLLTSRLLGFVSAITKLASIPALLFTPEKLGDGALFEGNDTRPEIAKGLLPTGKFVDGKFIEISEKDIKAELLLSQLKNKNESAENYISSKNFNHAAYNSNISHLNTSSTTNADNSKYTDSSKNTININIQNANNPIDVQRAVQDALGSIKQQFRASALNHDSVIYR